MSQFSINLLSQPYTFRFMPKLNTHQKWHVSWKPCKLDKKEKDAETAEKKRLGNLIHQELGFDPTTPSKMPTGNMVWLLQI